MKVVSFLTCLALALSTFPLVPLCPGPGSPATSVMTLDVCTASGAAIHGSVDLPFLCEDGMKLIPSGTALLQEKARLPLASALFTVQVEPPPEF